LEVEMAKMENIQPENTGQPLNERLKMVLLAAFVVAAALTAYLTFIAVRDLVTSWELTSLPGVTIKEPPPTPEGGMGLVTDPSVPLQPVGGPTPEPWDGAERVTLLVMGLDYRDWESGDGPPRTDTMILLTLDPVNRTAGMLSIPRDLWVNIPGFDYGKINTAYQLGEAFQLPGGGPGLAMQTVEELLGVPIDFYAQIDFSAFVRFIDEIDGVKIDVPEEITVDPLGDNNLKTLKPGRQTLPGDLALAYARARKTEGGDFDRAQRQQQVILAIRDRIINFDMLPTLIRKSGVLYNELSSGIHTNLTLEQTIKLAWMAVQIPEDQIRRGIIGAEQVNFQTSPEGLDILKPLPNEVRKLRDEIFTDTGPASPAAADMDPLESMQAENARVAVLNGTYTPGLAARTTEYLKSQGVNVTETGNAQSNVTYTEITFYTGKPYTVAYLVDLMGINQYRIHHLFDPANSVDVSVVLGEDWAGNNPMP
jgi:LCP family protein required for cell wall assembly